MPRTIKLPDDLDGAQLSGHAVAEGGLVAPGGPLAAYQLDGASRTVVLEGGGIVLRLLGKPGQHAGAGAPIAIVGEPGETMGYDPGSVRTVRVLVQRRCEECGSDYPVNGLTEKVRCPRCGDLQIASPGFWRQYLAEDVAAAREPGEGSGGSFLAGLHGPCTRSCWGIPPLCRGCGTLLAWEGVVQSWNDARDNGAGAVHCTECGEGHRARLPPEWAVPIFPGLVLLIGETATTPGQSPGAKPVVFKCPDCLAPLQVDGVKRIVPCRYCDADVYLPDDLWIHLNPGAKRTRWWMLFTP